MALVLFPNLIKITTGESQYAHKFQFRDETLIYQLFINYHIGCSNEGI